MWLANNSKKQWPANSNFKLGIKEYYYAFGDNKNNVIKKIDFLWQLLLGNSQFGQINQQYFGFRGSSTYLAQSAGWLGMKLFPNSWSCFWLWMPPASASTSTCLSPPQSNATIQRASSSLLVG